LQLTQLTVTKRGGSRLSSKRPFTETYGCGEIPPIEKGGGGGDGVMEIRPARKATPEIKPLISNYGVVRGSGKASTQTFIVLEVVNASLKVAAAL
jgi:hypothetical protein